MKRVSLVVTDLDNTLWDWVGQWYAAFDAMVASVSARSGVSRERLEQDMRRVFQRHGTSEYPHVIEETECLRRLHPGENLSVRYADAITARREASEESVCLYPGVMETLLQLRSSGCRIVAYTESMSLYSMSRIRKHGLDGIIDELYSPQGHSQTVGLPASRSLTTTRQRFTPPGELKPNKQVLLDIVAEQGISTAEAIFVGDSLMKDIPMARDAGIRDVLAKYGQAHDTAAYECLRRVTHWTAEDVERDRQLQLNGGVEATYVLHRSFAELLDLFDFGPPRI